MTQMPIVSDSTRLNEFQRRNLEEQIDSLRQLLGVFPRVTVEQQLNHDNLLQVEEWAKSTTVYLFNIFGVLANIPYRTRQMDQAVELIRKSFHAVFDLVFCTIRQPETEDFVRARLSVESTLDSCSNLV